MASVVNPYVLRPGAGLYDIIQSLGLTTGLVLCLDAGDSACYDGSSQTWTDRVGANNFLRGTTSGSDTTDPTFNGVAGAKSASEYFSFDGGDFFTESAAHTFADDWHKNNGAFTMLALYYIGASKSAMSKIFDNTGQLATASPGVSFMVQTNDTLRLFHAVNDTGTTESLTTTATVVLSSWNFLAAAFNEATPTCDLVINATAENFTPTASTATAAKAQSNRIGARTAAAASPFESGERLACFAAWSTKLTTTQVGNIYSLLKSARFTTLP